MEVEVYVVKSKTDTLFLEELFTGCLNFLIV